MGPAVQYLAGELVVEQGTVLPLLASHNTVRMRFDIEEAEYLHLAKPDAAFPALHFSMLADRTRNQVNFPPNPLHTATISTLATAFICYLLQQSHHKRFRTYVSDGRSPQVSPQPNHTLFHML